MLSYYRSWLFVIFTVPVACIASETYYTGSIKDLQNCDMKKFAVSQEQYEQGGFLGILVEGNDHADPRSLVNVDLLRQGCMYLVTLSTGMTCDVRYFSKNSILHSYDQIIDVDSIVANRYRDEQYHHEVWEKYLKEEPTRAQSKKGKANSWNPLPFQPDNLGRVADSLQLVLVSEQHVQEIRDKIDQDKQRIKKAVLSNMLSNKACIQAGMYPPRQQELVLIRQDQGLVELPSVKNKRF